MPNENQSSNVRDLFIRKAEQWRVSQRSFPVVLYGSRSLAVTPEQFDEALVAFHLHVVATTVFSSVFGPHRAVLAAAAQAPVAVECTGVVDEMLDVSEYRCTSCAAEYYFMVRSKADLRFCPNCGQRLAA